MAEDSTKQPDPPAAAPRKKRSRLHRWALRGLIAFAILLILIIITGEIIFQTDLPRDIVVRAVEKQLGLRVTAKSLTTGWLGSTRLHGVTLTLPLESKAFVDVPEMAINHTNLPWLAIRRSLTISSITIDHPNVVVLQDATGKWNFQDVAELLLRTGGSKSAGAEAASAPGDIPKLPMIDVHDATVIVVDRSGRKSTIYPLAVTGRPNGSLVWQWDAEIPDHFKCTARVSPGGLWEHSVDISIQNVGQWMTPWISAWPQNASASAQWNGQYVNDRLAGWLVVDQAHYGSIDARGRTQITNANGETTLKPRGVVVNNPAWRLPQISADDGEIDIATGSIESKHLVIVAAGGNASLDGKYTFADGAANVRAVWDNISLVKNVSQSGNLSAEYSVPFPGQMKVKAAVNSLGTLSAGNWNTSFDLNAQGTRGKDIDWKITAPLLHWDGTNHISADLSGLTATITTSTFGAVFHDIHLGNKNPIAGDGGYDAGKRLWWVALDGRGWPLPNAHHDTLDIDLNLWGDPNRIHLTQFYAATAGLSISSDGEIVLDGPKSLNANFNASEIPTPSADWMHGSLESNFSLTGHLSPLDLKFTGDASGADLAIKNRPIGDMALKVLGTIQKDPDLGPQISFESSHIDLFGGECAINGKWPVKDKLINADLDVKDISLAQALARPEISGTLNGSYTVGLNNLSINGLQIEQHNSKPTTIDQLRIGKFQVDKLTTGKLVVYDGRVILDPIYLQRKDFGVDGRAQASIRTTLSHPEKLGTTFQVSAWPYRLASNLNVVGWADGKMNLDLAQRTARGGANIQTDINVNDATVAIKTRATIRERIIRLDSGKIDLLDGAGDGSAMVDLDHLTQSTASINLKGVNAEAIRQLWPKVHDLSGNIDGSLKLQPATDPRALGPLAFTMKMHPTNGHFAGFKFGDAQAFGYLGNDRLVLDDSPERRSQLAIAGGVVSFWGRVSKHDGDQYQSLLQFNLINVGLNDIFHANDADAKYTPGLLNGQITVVGHPGQPDLAFGEGHITLSHADLAPWGPMDFIYNATHTSHDPNQPVGHGKIDLTLANENIEISSFRYFDRGTEVRGAGTIYDIAKVPDNPILLNLAGAYKPFSSINLPGIADLNAALGALQEDSVPVEITGTLRKYSWRTVAFDALNQNFRDSLVGEVRGQNDSSQ